jgi:hypothetical protein
LTPPPQVSRFKDELFDLIVQDGNKWNMSFSAFTLETAAFELRLQSCCPILRYTDLLNLNFVNVWKAEQPLEQ